MRLYDIPLLVYEDMISTLGHYPLDWAVAQPSYHELPHTSIGRRMHITSFCHISYQSQACLPSLELLSSLLALYISIILEKRVGNTTTGTKKDRRTYNIQRES